jgi:hypothetical protein
VSGLRTAALATHKTAIVVIARRPTGPKVVALFSHRDQCGIAPPVWIG